MQYDLIIRNGTIVDGSGLPRYRADVGIVDGRIASIGKVSGSADETRREHNVRSRLANSWQYRSRIRSLRIYRARNTGGRRWN